MKIYDKFAFFMGILWLCVFPLFALDIIEGDWFKYMVAASISIACFYRAFSKTAYERNLIIGEHFRETARSLYGRFYFIKTNLPWIVMLAYVPIALLLRFAVHIWLPAWVHLIFVVAFTISTFYSIGIINSIKEEIEQKIENDDTDP